MGIHQIEVTWRPEDMPTPAEAAERGPAFQVYLRMRFAVALRVGMAELDALVRYSPQLGVTRARMEVEHSPGRLACKAIAEIPDDADVAARVETLSNGFQQILLKAWASSRQGQA